MKTRSLSGFNPYLITPKFKLIWDSDLKGHQKQEVNPGAYSLEVLKNDKITTDPNNEIFRMELKNSANLDFEVGDELCVWPHNSKSSVQRLIARLGFNGNVTFHLESLNETMKD